MIIQLPPLRSLVKLCATQARRVLYATSPITLLGALLLSVPLILMSLPHFQRPERTPLTQTLTPGVTYERKIFNDPRPVVLHQITLDLTQKPVTFQVTPGVKQGKSIFIPASTTSEYLLAYNLDLAVNASFFQPFREETPWDYWPHRGAKSYPVGLAIANGKTYSPLRKGFSTFCVLPDQVLIQPKDDCPENTQQAVAGNAVFLREGAPYLTRHLRDQDKPYSRTVLALDKQAKTLWIIVVDGKQPWYSEGLRMDELANYTQFIGAETALNLDGGGSVTLAVQTPNGPKLLNSPIQFKIPMQERPISTHLGLRWSTVPSLPPSNS